MAELKDTKVLKRLPEFLLKRLDGNQISSNAELPFEFLDPNTINLSAALIEQMITDLDDIDFNDWSDFNSYIKEFKLSEVFEDVDEGFYTVTQPELLKGFFAFKGTEIDIQYLLKISGFSLIIFDSSYFQDAESMYTLLITRPGGFQDDIDLILAAMTPEEIDTGFSQLNPHIADNAGPLVLNNEAEMYVVNAAVGISDWLLTKGVVLSPEGLAYIESLYQIFYSSFYSDYEATNCNIKSQLFVNLDSPDFVGFKPNTTNKQIRALLRTRLSPCVYLSETEVFLETKDFYSVPVRVTEDLSISLDYEFAEDAPSFYEEFVLEYNQEIPEEMLYLETDDIHIQPHARNDNLYLADNLNPRVAKGNLNHLFLEENLESFRSASIPVIKTWTPLNRGDGWVDEASYPSNRRLVSYDVTGLVGSLQTDAGLLSNGDIVKFDPAGDVESITQIDSWTPISDGLGNVNPTSYPAIREARYFRVSGMGSSLESVVGTLDNNDTVYFNYEEELSLSILI